jgi:hypothetical protein
MNTTIIIFLVIVLILILLNVLQVLGMGRCSKTMSYRSKKEDFTNHNHNDNSVSVLYDDNKEHANYQELPSYIQKTNHRDFMYKDKTMAIPSDFNMC